MARSLNTCMFIGNLGADPEVRYTQSGTACASFSIAVADDYKDKNTGQKVEQTEWVRVSAFGRTAEVAGEYLRKGAKVFVSGKLKTRKWQDQSGQDRYSTEVVVNDLQMLDTRSGQQGGGQQQAPAQQQRQAAPQQAQAAQSQGGDPYLEDIPFLAYHKGAEFVV